jgi:hypothetical protein
MTTHIICLKWGKKYESAYVNKLYKAVQRNITIPFEFHCFTEDARGISGGITIHSLPVRADVSGWWNKLWLFSPEFPLSGKILYIDLDTLITGNIDEIASVDGFVVLRDFYASMAKGVSTVDIGSGLMSWESGSHHEIWDKFIANPRGAIRSLHPHGDQRWIQKFVMGRRYWQDILVDQVVSFKCHCVNGLPGGARVVCYHGKPSIPDSIRIPSRGWRNTRIPISKWVGEHWYE